MVGDGQPRPLGFIVPPHRKDAEDAFAVATLPAVRANTRTSLWPERWPAIALQECIDLVEAAPPDEQERVKFDLPCQACPVSSGCLNAKRKEIGSLMYDREILTTPRSGESSLFPRSLFTPMLMADEGLVPYYRKPFGVEHEFVVVQAWDLAWSEKTGGDWLVCMTGLLNRVSKRKRILDVQRWQRQTFGQQIALIERKAEDYSADMVVIESDSAQAIWTQHAAETTSVPVIKHSAGDKTSLQQGVPGLLVDFENRRWEIPFRPGTLRHDEVNVWLNEMEAFGWVDGHLQGVGEHDDTVMCFWHLWWGLNHWDRMAGISQQSRGVVPGAR